MVLGGLWHGASWNVLLWGTLHGIALIMHKVWTTRDLKLPSAPALLLTQGFVLLCWVPFRCREWSHTLSFFSTTASPDAKTAPDVDITWHWLVLPLVIDALLQLRPAPANEAKPLPAWAIGAAYAILFVLVLALGTWDSKAFIYFQF
jgi:hypothetical protein